MRSRRLLTIALIALLNVALCLALVAVGRDDGRRTGPLSTTVPFMGARVSPPAGVSTTALTQPVSPPVWSPPVPAVGTALDEGTIPPFPHSVGSTTEGPTTTMVEPRPETTTTTKRPPVGVVSAPTERALT
jgi:hypothetical protein